MGKARSASREPKPAGRCTWCGGELEWSRVRFVPPRLSARGVAAARWEGCEARCRNVHDPAHVGVGGRGTGGPSTSRPDPAEVARADRWSAVLRTDPATGRRERAQQLWPFGIAVVAAFVLSALPPHAAHAGLMLLLAGTCFTAAAVLVVAVPWHRLPESSPLVIVAVFCVGVALLRASGGGSAAGYGPLLLLPIIWQAIYGRPFELGATIAAATGTMVAPILLVGGRDYPVGQWRAVVLFTLIGGAIGFVVQRLVTANAEITERFETLANIDSLTGLPSRRAWDDRVATTLARRPAGEPTALVLVDIDHFKAFNDEHGHVKADHTLRLIADEWSERLRPGDLLARWGGEEFAFLLPDTAAVEAAVVVHGLAAVTPESLTFSAGLLTISSDVSAEDAMTAADELLYLAKRSGRARIACASTPALQSHEPASRFDPTIEHIAPLFPGSSLSVELPAP